MITHDSSNKTTDSSESTDVCLRPYQRELVKHACKGENVIICAPTGSGKTIVAAYILKQHIDEARRIDRSFKSCFIVPTKHLVEQQESVICKWVGRGVEVKGIYGGKRNSSFQQRRRAIEGADVVVCTPQILLNVITEKPVDEASNRYFKPFNLTQFTLIIFDEAHHTRDDHPYNVLMGSYHELKLTGVFYLGRHLPQIIGMTASLGIGGGSMLNTPEECVEYILLTCANLDTNRISQVCEFKDNLQHFMPYVIDVIEYVNLENYLATTFCKLLLCEIDHLKTLMRQIPEVIKNEVVYEKLFDHNSKDPLLVAFEHWAYTLKRCISKAPNISVESRELLMLYAEQILIFYHAITDMRLFGAKMVLESIEGREVDFFPGKSSKLIVRRKHVLKLLKQYLKRNPRENDSPLLIKLISLLTKQFSANGHSRVIIFLKQRDFCKKLSTILNEKTRYPTSCFIGQNASGNCGGQTINQQNAVIRAFRENKFRVLCATSVAEEGLDISVCNLVVQYNNVTNEIARIQRRYDVVLKEKQNRDLELLMDKTLKEIGQMPQNVFQDKVGQLVHELNEKRRAKGAQVMHSNSNGLEQDAFDGVILESNETEEMHDAIAEHFYSHQMAVTLNSEVPTNSTVDKTNAKKEDVYLVNALLNTVFIIRGNISLVDCYELLLTLYGERRCKKMFRTEEHLLEFIKQNCHNIHFHEGLSTTTLLWEIAGDASFRTLVRKVEKHCIGLSN